MKASRFTTRPNDISKNKRFHIGSILREIKNKNVIEEIDNERKFSEANLIKPKPKLKKKSRKDSVPTIEIKPPQEPSKSSVKETSVNSFESESDDDSSVDHLIIRRNPLREKKTSLIPCEPANIPR